MNIHFQAMLKAVRPQGHGVAFGYPVISKGKRKGIRNEQFFTTLDVKMDFFDLKEQFGVEKFLDLNKPLPNSLFQKYDFLINPGTYEHCFNIAQAMQNGYDILKPESYSYHTGPIARGVHGFWNFNECTFSSFYENHGGKVVHQETINGSLFVTAINGVGRAKKSFPYKEIKNA